MGQEEGHKVKLDEYGQLAIGYDLAKARAWVLDHAQKNLPARYPWLHGLELAWEVTSARFMEEQDAYEVVACYPEGAEVQAKGEWLYHVDVKGQLMPGTPVLKAVGRWAANSLSDAAGGRPAKAKGLLDRLAEDFWRYGNPD